MKRRVTLIHKPEDGIDPSSVRVTDGVISGPELLAAREERLTFDLDELPDEVGLALGRCTGPLHVRWETSSSYESSELLSSRVSPGLHVFYTPPETPGDELYVDDPSPRCREEAEVDGGFRINLCSTLESLVGELNCKDPDSFIKLPSADGGARDDVYQYYQPYEQPGHLIGALEATLCAASSSEECRAGVGALQRAASVDILYDPVQRILRLQAIWPSDTHVVGAKNMDGHKTEVGVFATDSSAGDAHELGVGGILIATPHEKKEPSILAFTVSSRHRRADADFSARLLTPQGLHPTLQLAISSATPPPDYEDQGGCGLHAYLTLPRTIFADRYQLADDLFMASKNLSALRYASQPVDLEMPEYKTAAWGSTVLLDLAPPANLETSADGASSPWTAEVPLHLRYMEPAPGGYSEAKIPYPVVFWACQSAEDAPFSGNPWDRTSLGYDGLFGPETVYWHAEPRPGTLGEDALFITAKVPVLPTEKSGWVETATAATIVVGFAWVLFSLFSASRASGVSGKKAATRAKKVQ